ncbi:glutathione-dependent disulfide-bond oxidoreductase [Novosphingobium sp.]|uniref:glutathione-dependent disulfide-bond oxidoreductase n=1 Tax=Novosphingobium sp. TaxID=1874826 RepID=UPI003566ADF3
MADDYVPPEVWTWDKANGGAFANVNRPISGPTSERELPVGKHPFQVYSLGTPNGQKATIMLEELLQMGFAEAEYDAWLIRIMDGDQFTSGYVEINPNSKIPAMVDRSGPEPFRVFESGAILMHLAEKFGVFLPTSGAARAECLSWLLWQVGSAPFIGGGFGHFYHYAPVKIEYAIDRYSMETKRLFDVANRQLARTRFLAGDDYTIADIATYTWFGNIYRGEAYGEAATFLSMHEYEHVGRWVGEIDARPGVLRGRLVNSSKGISERHDASDFNALPAETLQGIAKGY